MTDESEWRAGSSRAMRPATSGQLKMRLASVLSRRLTMPDAFSAAIEIIDAGLVPEKWRLKLGDEASQALEADLEEMRDAGELPA